METGNRVGYIDESLRHYRGVVVSDEPGPHGGDCEVTWDHTPEAKVEECAFNLRLLDN